MRNGSLFDDLGYFLVVAGLAAVVAAGVWFAKSHIGHDGFDPFVAAQEAGWGLDFSSSLVGSSDEVRVNQLPQVE